MSIGEYAQAAKTAILIANQEQKIGSYQIARNILFETHQDLVAQKIAVPTDLTKNLLLLQSYTLVKKLVKSGDHKSAARMLIRVAKSISKFPSHVVPILTSTVIECQRAGLKRSSFEYASMLMRPEYRNTVDKRYRRKIEAIVRRPAPKEEDEKHSACPVCQFELPETLLDCPQCRSILPYCCVTGRHMVLDDWAQCPSCHFPALYSQFTEWIKENEKCSMCSTVVQPSAILKIDDPKPLLNKNNGGADINNTELPVNTNKDGETVADPANAPAPPKKANW
jgi:WD repeat-containing protein 19